MYIQKQITGFNNIEHDVDLCVVGGGLAGMFAAISAARRGVKVALMQDRPVLGGNASSEIRMWIRGAHGENNRETGLLEEIALENIYRNPTLNFSIWDSVLYEKVRFEKNIKLLLNCSCCEAQMDGDSIVSIKGWQTTTQTWHTVRAKIFADCSGDSILAPLTGAEFRMGREGCGEYGEDIAPAESDKCTMGMSCLFQARETSKPVKFTAPKWANKYTLDDFPFRLNCSDRTSWTRDNYWWMEIGGVHDSIHDTEKLRDELLKIAFGVWDFIKNSGHFDSENWDLDWLGFLPGKRESRRYVGDYILTQKDVRSGGHFDDLIAYGGWTMDDHHPMGFETKEKPTIFHPAPSPYGIPYRCLYSKNIKNLMFAGRNISTTHSALSSCRVMATCGLLGQALGTAASIAVKYELLPRDIYHNKIHELRQALMDDDCYLPFARRKFSPLTQNAAITASAGCIQMLTDGIERKLGEEDHAWEGELGSEIIIDFGKPSVPLDLRVVFDSDLNRESHSGYYNNLRLFPMRCNIFLNDKALNVPETLIKAFSVQADDGSGIWKDVYNEDNNYQRLVKINLAGGYLKIRFIPKETWGYKNARIYSLDVSD